MLKQNNYSFLALDWIDKKKKYIRVHAASLVVKGEFVMLDVVNNCKFLSSEVITYSQDFPNLHFLSNNFAISLQKSLSFKPIIKSIVIP